MTFQRSRAGSVRVLLLCALLTLFGPGAASARSVLFVLQAKPWMDQYVDPAVKSELNKQGWQVGTAETGDLTWDLLRQFNVVVLCRIPADTPQDGGAARGALLDQKAPLLYRFVQAGGGLLLLHDESYDQVYITENRFLKPLGAEIVNEQVTDLEHAWRQPDYLQYWFAWTTDVTPGHPITEGVHTLWYPLGYDDRHDRKTSPLILDSSWTVLAKAMPTAFSYRSTSGTGFGAAGEHKTISASPPILAARSYGQGRAALFPSHSTFTLQSGRHTIWQEIVLSRGDGRRPSDTGRMLFNAMAWLGEPSATAKDLGGFRQPAARRKGAEPAPIYRPERQPAYQAHTFRGLIGAHSAVSDGDGTVAEWAGAARSQGYDFLVFTESFPPLTEEKWRRLREDCAAASDRGFLCIPGMEYRDVSGSRYITFAFPQWPKQEWLTKTGDRVQDTPGLYFGNDWAPLAVIETMHNPVSPWFLKFYGALSVFSYRVADGRCTRTDEALPAYLRLMGDQYNSVPIVFHDMRRPGDLKAAAGFVNCAWAASLSDVPRSFRHVWYAQPQAAYITEGPRLGAWWIENGASDNGTPGHASRPWRLHVDVRSDSPLREVAIHDGSALFRRFIARDSRFTATIEGLHERQRYFVLTAVDARGRRLISPTLRTADSRHSVYMCTDMQNTLECGVTRDRDGRWTYVWMLGNYVTGWDGLNLGMLVPSDEIMPQGLDYVVKGFNGGVSHQIAAKQGSESAIAPRELAFGSGDCVMLDNDFSWTFGPNGTVVRTRLADSRVRFVSYTQRIYSHNLLLVERDTVLKQRVESRGAPAPDFGILSISGPNESFSQYAYIRADNVRIAGKRADPAGVVADGVPVRTGGYVALYPDFYGSAGVFPLRSDIRFPGGQWQAQDLCLRIQGATATVGCRLPSGGFPEGTRLRQTFVVMRARFGDAGAACFDDVRRLFGMDGPMACRANVERGVLGRTRYLLDLTARDGAAVARLDKAPLPSDLPVRVAGLQDNWSAVCVDLPGVGRERTSVVPWLCNWRPAGMLHGTAYLTLDVNDGPRRIFVGHPALCDRPDITLNLLRWDRSGITLEAHNPGQIAVSIQLRVHPVFGTGRHAAHVPAESSVIVHLPWRR